MTLSLRRMRRGVWLVLMPLFVVTPAAAADEPSNVTTDLGSGIKVDLPGMHE